MKVRFCASLRGSGPLKGIAGWPPPCGPASAPLRQCRQGRSQTGDSAPLTARRPMHAHRWSMPTKEGIGHAEPRFCPSPAPKTKPLSWESGFGAQSMAGHALSGRRHLGHRGRQLLSDLSESSRNPIHARPGLVPAQAHQPRPNRAFASMHRRRPPPSEHPRRRHSALWQIWQIKAESGENTLLADRTGLARCTGGTFHHRPLAVSRVRPDHPPKPIRSRSPTSKRDARALPPPIVVTSANRPDIGLAVQAFLPLLQHFMATRNPDDEHNNRRPVPPIEQGS